jgi:hypothetical protein
MAVGVCVCVIVPSQTSFIRVQSGPPWTPPKMLQEGAAINLHIHPHPSHKRAVPIGSGCLLIIIMHRSWHKYQYADHKAMYRNSI